MKKLLRLQHVNQAQENILRHLWQLLLQGQCGIDANVRHGRNNKRPDESNVRLKSNKRLRKDHLGFAELLPHDPLTVLFHDPLTLFSRSSDR